MGAPPNDSPRGPLRLEDPALLRGQGHYLDDLAPAGATGAPLHAVFVRSHDAHGHLAAVDVADALEAPGVVAVLTASDLGVQPVPGHAMLAPAFARPPLATDTVHFAGEAVAVVVAESRVAAVDAAEMVVVDIDPLPPVTDLEASCAATAASGSGTVLFPGLGTNVAFEGRFGTADDPCADAPHVVEGRFVNQRVAPAPMEPDGVLAVPDGDRLLVWASTQRVHHVRDAIASSLGLDPALVRVVAPLVGGGFGGKFEPSAEAVAVAACARTLDRPVQWVQTRTENLQSMPQGRGQRQRARLAVDADGGFLGLDVDVLADAGAYPMVGAVIPNATGLMASGPYRIPLVRAAGRAAATTTSPVGAYRGAGRPEATAMLERLVDVAARRLAIDPVELRRRNLLEVGDYPYTTPTGMTYDSGDPRRCLDEACARIDYDALRARQAQRRAGTGTRHLGIGIAMWLDCTPMNRPSEYASIRIDPDASDPDGVRVLVRDGANDQGQGHRTTWAVLISAVLGLAASSVELPGGDTDEVPTGEGTGSARSLMLAGAAVDGAARQVLDQARAVAAHLLEAAPADIVVTSEGTLAVVGSPSAEVSWARVARAAADPSLPDDVRSVVPEGHLGAAVESSQPGPTFPEGCHAAVVEVDAETGHVELVRFIAVDDCGRVVHPTLVAGQQHGGIVQGIGQALFEAVQHDEDGTPLSTTLLDYAVPSAPELPSIEATTIDLSSPVNPLGAKGIGQAGAIGATVAVQNAVIDAVAHLGVEHIDLPLTPERVWSALAGAGCQDRIMQ
ncbi:xanthine dehydrogenase family protein molybdopterin-binding subunit [Rhabdothermincola salaria]|uniref:xanthine dehydrogenase family protein molybdopterin-binding subunit n=1 Tax=Rhabdothermincola salaria TaxID=2903142 RepID=UPI001E38CEA7|nr:xanthine dehydrogenase family protein molybdopterin-binding subunit [Rhabdothermincola salaria]MCD9622959.1 xanthine dehydrogenase family protein molybdopterin-binding subunit [Rhabdothermincola salaria]